jgi:hypothetical protein
MVERILIHLVEYKIKNKKTGFFEAQSCEPFQGYKALTTTVIKAYRQITTNASMPPFTTCFINIRFNPIKKGKPEPEGNGFIHQLTNRGDEMKEMQVEIALCSMVHWINKNEKRVQRWRY